MTTLNAHREAEIMRILSSCFIVVAALCFLDCQACAAAEPKANNAHWVRHTIDDTSKGADGVRLADVNGDGLPDIATGWEQGGLTRVYLHPGNAKVGVAWPVVTVGRATSVEDAVFADLDGDGAVDVVSCCEG